MKEAGENILGYKKGSKKEAWITADTWKAIDDIGEV